jgi:hypothetical protein
MEFERYSNSELVLRGPKPCGTKMNLCQVTLYACMPRIGTFYSYKQIRMIVPLKNLASSLNLPLIPQGLNLPVEFYIPHVECTVYTVQNPRRHVDLKKPAKFVQYVHTLEGICLLVYTFTSASLLGEGHFCRYVFHLINKINTTCGSVTVYS